METGDAGATPKASDLVQAGGRTVSEGHPRDDDWGIRGCIQFGVHTNFLKTVIACVHVIIYKITVPP